MWTPTSAAWTVRGATFALWALAAASVVAWGLALAGGGRPLAVPLPALRPVAAVDPSALARLLGGVPAATAGALPAPSLSSRFQLVGVAAGARSGGGAALISVDGKPARPYRVGAEIEDGVTLQAVQGRQAVLAAAGGGQVMLELPPLPTPRTQSPMAAPR